eukprot:s150_g7.t1
MEIQAVRQAPRPPSHTAAVLRRPYRSLACAAGSQFSASAKLLVVGLGAATVVGRARRPHRSARRRGIGDASGARGRSALQASATTLEDPDVDESATDEEDEDDPSIQVRQKMEIERVLPEDKLREEWVMPVKRPKGKRSIRPKSLKRVKWDEEDWERDHGKNPWSSFALAPAREKEMVAKSWVDDARRAARERAQQDRHRHRIGDDVGTGPSSPNAYVEIRERWDGPEQEAVNVVVAEELDIPPETASRLVNLGAVWFYDEFEERDRTQLQGYLGQRHPQKPLDASNVDEIWQDWIRIMKPQKVRYDTVLRVFPNPERYKTCYLDDWDERIKKDFVVVDKPPLLPCHAHVTNGKETLSRAVADGLNVRSVQEVELGMDDTRLGLWGDFVGGHSVLIRRRSQRSRGFPSSLEPPKLAWRGS